MSEAKSLTALERYQSLMRQADELERIAGEGNFGGMTFWGNMRDCTRQAISDKEYKPERETWRMGEATIRAIHFVAPDHFDPIWKAAAVCLRAEANRLREELASQKYDLDKILEEMK